MGDDTIDSIIQTMDYKTYNGTVSNADTITYQLIQDAVLKMRGKSKLIIDDIEEKLAQKEITVEDVFRTMDNEID